MGEDTQRKEKSMETVNLFLFPLCLLTFSGVKSASDKKKGAEL